MSSRKKVYINRFSLYFNHLPKSPPMTNGESNTSLVISCFERRSPPIGRYADALISYTPFDRNAKLDVSFHFIIIPKSRLLMSTTLYTVVGSTRSTAHQGFVSFSDCAHCGLFRINVVEKSPSLAKPALAFLYTLLRNAGLCSAALYVVTFDSPAQYT